jgi:hypothetical protein
MIRPRSQNRIYEYAPLERHTVLRGARVYCVLLEVQTEASLDKACRVDRPYAGTLIMAERTV